MLGCDLEPLEEGDDLVLPKQPEIQIKVEKQIEDRFFIKEELGKGKFGVVKKCQDKADGQLYAAKYVKKTAQSKIDLTNEIAMMGKLHHKRLVRLIDAFETPKFMIVVMELITGGELFEKVVEEDNLTERQVVRYLRQVLFAVQHMHRYNMVHLDLKPENILCVGGEPPGYEQLKLIDFGMARILDKSKKETAACGTAEFVAPEVLRLDPISLAVDMWSLGVITYVLLSGLSPFLGDSDNETLRNVSNGEYDFDDGEDIFDQISDNAKQFIEALLELDVAKRMTIDECLQHEWLTRAKEKKLKTDKLKKFIARRRWQRTTNALKALQRFGQMGLASKIAKPHEPAPAKHDENKENTATVETVTASKAENKDNGGASDAANGKEETESVPDAVNGEKEVKTTPDPVNGEKEVKTTPDPVNGEKEVKTTPDPVNGEKEVKTTPDPVNGEKEAEGTTNAVNGEKEPEIIESVVNGEQEVNPNGMEEEQEAEDGQVSFKIMQVEATHGPCKFTVGAVVASK
eukprot:gene17479-19227_t